MAVFTYKGRTSEGSFEEGTVEAEDRAGALRQLHEKDFHVQGLDAAGIKLSSGRKKGTRSTPTSGVGERQASPAPQTDSAAPGLSSLFVRIPLRQRAAFWRQAHHGQHAGMTIAQTLDLLADDPSRLGRFARTAMGEAGRGRLLSELMAEERLVFDPIEVAMIRAGEANGRLDVQMRRLSEHFEHQMEVWNMIRWKLMWIGLQWIALIGTSFVLMVVAPALMAYGFHKPTHLFSRLVTFGIPLVLAAAALIAIRTSFASSGAMRRGVDRLKLSLPVVGPLFRKLAVARYTRVLGDLLGAGVAAGQAAEIAAPVSGNLHLSEELAGIPAKLRSGGQLSDALIETCQFPRAVVQMVKTGEQSGTTDQLLDRIATYYEQEAISATQTLVVVGYVVSIIAFGVITLIALAKGYTGYFNSILNMDLGG